MSSARHTNPQEVADAFVALAESVSGVASASDVEPKTLGSLPAVALLQKAPRVVGYDTGGVDYEWSWRVAVYVSSKNGREQAQRDVSLVTNSLMWAFMDRPALGLEGLDFAHLEGDGEPEFNDAERWCVQAMTFKARGYRPHNVEA